MGILNKLQFWKHDDDFASEQPPSYDLGAQHYDPLQQPDPLSHNPQGQSDPFATHQDAIQEFAPSTQQYPMQSSFPGRPQAMQMPQSAQQAPDQYQQYPEQAVHPRDVELILAKLDAIKSELDALHQRVKKIEQVNDSTANSAANQKKYW